jgi:hypothetical protein
VNNGLERGFEKLRVEVQTGTQNVLLKGDYITGEWASEAVVHRIDETRAIALELLNVTHVQRKYEDAALDFTKKFGPITILFGHGASFKFSISEWKSARQQLHIAWKAASSTARWNRSPLYLPIDGDHFIFEKAGITFRTQKLLTYAALEIASIPTARLRRCANFPHGCKSPFFFASDLRERYCSQRCANEAKKRAKLRWWNENRRGGEDGT